LVAHHYTEASLTAPAVVYWQRAGQRAFERSANLEAMGHLTRGLELLDALPDTPERRQQELDVQITLGAVLAATKGFGAPDTESAFARAWELGQQVQDPAQLLPVLWGFCQAHIEQGKVQTAHELAEQLMRLAQRGQ